MSTKGSGSRIGDGVCSLRIEQRRAETKPLQLLLAVARVQIIRDVAARWQVGSNISRTDAATPCKASAAFSAFAVPDFVVVDEDDDIAATQRLGELRRPGGAAGYRGRGQIERGDTVGVLFALAEKNCRVRKLEQLGQAIEDWPHVAEVPRIAAAREGPTLAEAFRLHPQHFVE